MIQSEHDRRIEPLAKMLELQNDRITLLIADEDRRVADGPEDQFRLLDAKTSIANAVNTLRGMREDE